MKQEPQKKFMETEMKTILDSILCGIAIIDAETHKIIEINPVTAKLIGAPPEQIIGHLCHRFICPAEKGKCPITDLGQKVDNSERVLLKADGSGKVPIIKSVNAVVLKGRRYLLETFFDYTQYKKVGESLEQSEERFKQVTESAGEWIWEVDKEGLYTYTNSIVEKILGYKPEEIVGKKHFYDFFAPDVKEDLKKKAVEAFAQKMVFKNFLNLNMHKNGNVVLLETSGLPILDEKGNLVGYRGTDTDITEHKKSEEELKNRAKELEQMNKLMIGRELKMVEMKKEIEELKKKLGQA